MAQGVGPEFKPQYHIHTHTHQKKKKKRKKERKIKEGRNKISNHKKHIA
jgi:hypothetical protein